MGDGGCPGSRPIHSSDWVPPGGWAVGPWHRTTCASLPSGGIRDDEHQANKYRDTLHHKVPGTKIETLMLGAGRDPKVPSHYETEALRVASFVELVAQAREELKWRLGQLQS
jgi:hypothetical protein